MTPATIATLVLGSSVLGAVFGAYIKSSTERETEFRERMVKASVDFLSLVKGAQDALGHALRSVNDVIAAEAVSEKMKENAAGALAAVDASMSDLRGMIPLLLIVFPTAEVSEAAQALTDELDAARARLASGWRDGTRIQFASDVVTRVDVLHLRYAEAVRRDIRRGAYRSRFWEHLSVSGNRRKSTGRLRPSPIPPLRYRLRGPSVLKSKRWRSMSS